QMFEKIGARVEIPGCSLCMGNQARVDDSVTVFSTSTRNFDNRMGNGARVFLGSAELAAVVAKLGRIPTAEEYFEAYNKFIAPHRDEIYRYLNFHEMEEYVARAKSV
ncbi:MAG: aconitate hydratase B, partial [Planctomycetes bacterium]|nr:aconitate hydratase B [Planctomycetota bacterium]